ncbi:MAG: adenine phosphoribosyltransferase [Coriobacteriia bacterium]|nr:adenine phosphoribosyltransferase [Coriobacteriia bacterium]MBN2821818.1 adenine phosphoribosyltransferase [Coriobacteriia bacterium]
MDLEQYIRDIPDFPKEGIVFKDITPLLASPDGFRRAIDTIADEFADAGITKVLGAEARGFIFGGALAYRLGAGFVPARKPGKLPGKTTSAEYALEYGTDSLEIHEDAMGPSDRVLIVDDVLATGGTAAAKASLVSSSGAETMGFAFLIELDFLSGREKLGDRKIVSLIHVV